VPVGETMLGRVVDPLGVRSTMARRSSRPRNEKVDIIAPGIADRQPVHEPLQTGIKAIDSMIPVGRGQRELIIGDRKTGKTAVALDAIINQKQYWGTKDAVVCIYVAVGQKESTVAGVVETLKDNAMDYTTVVLAGSPTRPRCSTSRPTPAARWASTSCGAASKTQGCTPCGLRRPVQAGRGLPPALAAAASPARS
jgi:F0F1-type ATP synthase alpha subunit